MNGCEVAGRAVPAQLIGELQDSAGLLSDPQRLQDQLVEQGYLLLRGALDRSEVMAAREEVAQRLVEVGEIQPPARDAIATGFSKRKEMVGDLGAFWKSVSEGPALRRVTHGPTLYSLAEAVMGGSVRGQDYLFLRAGVKGRFTGTHCDYPFFTRKTERVITFWIPLGEAPVSDGPLYIVEGSHRFDDLNADVKGFDVALDGSRRATLDEDAVTLAQRRRRRLLTTNFEPGDVTVFGMFTWHGAFDNHSPIDRVRLSCDVRYQPADCALDPRYFGSNPTGTTGAGYGELNGAKPLTEPWHVR